MGAAISSSVSILWPEQSLKANNVDYFHQCPVNNSAFAMCTFLCMRCPKGDVWLNIVLFVYSVVVCACRFWSIGLMQLQYGYIYTFTHIQVCTHIYLLQGKLCCFYCSLQIILGIGSVFTISCSFIWQYVSHIQISGVRKPLLSLSHLHTCLAGLLCYVRGQLLWLLICCGDA